MKTVVEFGIRGGYHIDNLVFPSVKLAMQTAAAIANAFDGSGMIRPQRFAVSRSNPRETWQNSTHFVAVSILDGTARGPASAKLWKKEG